MLYPDLSEQFNDQFDIVLASNDSLRNEVYRIRYAVYCEELGYESSDKFPDRLEMDSFDQNSIHCLLRHKATGLWAGCVRLVLPSYGVNGLAFPCEKLFGSFSQQTESFPLNSVGEVSRLAVPSSFRRRTDERQSAYGINKNLSPTEIGNRRQFPIIPMSLYLAASSVALNHELEYVITVMEPRLARHLRYFGIHFEKISDFIDFNGKRALFLISRQNLLENIKPDCSRLLGIIQYKLSDRANLSCPINYQAHLAYSLAANS